MSNRLLDKKIEPRYIFLGISSIQTVVEAINMDKIEQNSL